MTFPEICNADMRFVLTLMVECENGEKNIHHEISNHFNHPPLRNIWLKPRHFSPTFKMGIDSWKATNCIYNKIQCFANEFN